MPASPAGSSRKPCASSAFLDSAGRPPIEAARSSSPLRPPPRSRKPASTIPPFTESKPRLRMETGHRRITAGNHSINRKQRAHPMTERYLAHFRIGTSVCCIGAAHPSRAAAHRCGRREARFRGDSCSFEVMTVDEHEARLALVRRCTRQGLRLLVETVQSHQSEGACEVSVALAFNGIAVRVQRIDPDTGRQQVRQEIWEDSGPIGM